MINTIIFDWGGVLIDNPAEDLINYCANKINADPKELKNIFKEYEKEFQKGHISEKELWKRICDKLNLRLPSLKDSLWKEAVKEVFREKPQIFSLIKKLKDKGYSLGVLSNTEIPTVEHFFEKKYDEYFDSMTFSCVEKTVKPEKKIYEIALKKLCARPEESIFIDDKPEYIEGAKKVGINGIVFKDIEGLLKELALYSVRID